MANFYQDETGLPVNIWIDTAKEYISGKHAKSKKKIILFLEKPRSLER